MKPGTKKALFALTTLLLLVLVLEGLLSLATFVSPRVARLLFVRPAIERYLADDRLGHRPNPEMPGSDSLGFRNASVPERATIVTLGDSQTWGTGVGAQHTWPRQVELIAETPVYSLAYPGYGPAHHMLMFEDAIGFEPEIVVATFYAGNDLFDAFNLAYNVGAAVDLKSADPAVRAGVEAAEAALPLADHVSAMLYTPPKKHDGFMARHSRLYGLGRRIAQEIAERTQGGGSQEEAWEAARRFAREHADFCQVYEGDGLQTVFTSEYRFAALDPTDPRITEGLRISLEALRRMGERATQEGVRLVVVLIPTKELVFREIVDEPTDAYGRLVATEARFWETTVAFLREQGIEYVDALPALRSRLVEGRQPYKVDHDGHPNPSGHEAIAEGVAAYLAGARDSAIARHPAP